MKRQPFRQLGDRSIGALLAGFVAELWGIRTMFATGGVVSVGLLFLFLGLISSERIKNSERAA